MAQTRRDDDDDVDHRGRDWGDAASAKDPWSPRSWRNDPPLNPLVPDFAPGTLTSDFWPPGL